ncbi:hypothetical protein HYDPIDRAFT_120583 [Hydnomerulius pinastri MD-312]|uniref:Uncharacterized protein n=1 Tax=Hydnomerulius pinastri MD-312 TaxID=994086 RepID=A0A0C2L7A5_9AGAM|nr:hypothetical protein HYDPIDRAFT_120583 [Hydnomerulius pinastri MD-312]
MCEARRADMIRVWRDLGGVIGIKEWDVKVGVRDGKDSANGANLLTTVYLAIFLHNLRPSC